MKKYKNVLIGLFIVIAVLVMSHYDAKWQIEEDKADRIAQIEYFDEQADELLQAYHDDCIEEEEFDELYNKLEKYDYNGKVYAFDAELEITALNEPKPYTGAE